MWRFHCGLMPANVITLPHFSVSSTISLPNWLADRRKIGQRLQANRTRNREPA
jgi:hypothetical protein